MERYSKAVIQPTTDIVQGMKEYWEVRSNGYSWSNAIEELNCFKRDEWIRILMENAPKKEKMKVLDVGAGPGLFSVLMASAGHDVTAVDISENMLYNAKKNAADFGFSIQTVLVNGCLLPFENDSFDLIVSRNVIWALDQPQTALQEWNRVLRPGGRTVYFDANWHLHLYDAEQRKKVELARAETERKFGKKYETTIQLKKLDNIAKDLMLSQVKRPAWDKKILPECGFEILKVEEDMGRYVWDEMQKTADGATPMFMVVAKTKK